METSQAEMLGWLKETALSNIVCIVFTLLTSHDPSSWSKASAEWKVPTIAVTWLVSQASGWFNCVEPNVPPMSVTELVSQASGWSKRSAR